MGSLYFPLLVVVEGLEQVHVLALLGDYTPLAEIRGQGLIFQHDIFATQEVKLLQVPAVIVDGGGRKRVELEEVHVVESVVLLSSAFLLARIGLATRGLRAVDSLQGLLVNAAAPRVVDGPILAIRRDEKLVVGPLSGG